MSEGQDSDCFVSEVSRLRDQLVFMGEILNAHSILDIVLEGLIDDYGRQTTVRDGDDCLGRPCWHLKLIRDTRATSPTAARVPSSQRVPLPVLAAVFITRRSTATAGD